jgi:hypothetical protein
MKTEKAGEYKNARELSDALIERRYLNLQKLRDIVRKAEISCALPLKQPRHGKRLAKLACSPSNNARPNFRRKG